MRSKYIRFLAVFVLVFATAFLLPKNTQNCAFEDTYKMVTVRHLHTSIHSAVANTDALRELGLGNRACMPDNQGMLFEFANADKYGFWMKDMRFAIDILWINANKKVISIQRDVDPSTYPSTYYPSEPALYVLELPHGKATSYVFVNGTQLSW